MLYNIEVKSYLIYVLFILLLSFIHLLSSFLNLASISMGILIFSILVYIVNIKYWNRLYYLKVKFASLIVIFLLYLLITAVFTNNFLNLKAYLSVFSLLFVFGAAYLASYSLKYKDNRLLYRIIKYTFFIFMLLGLFHLIFIGGARNPFPFSEASHYALFIGPFSVVLYILSSSKFLKFFIISWLLSAGILFPNTTVLMYVFLIFLLHIKLTIKNIILVIFGGIIIINTILNNDYFSERIFFWNDQSSKNLSSLVYLQGVQDAYYSFVSTNGFGIGFQQLGTQKSSEAGLIIQELMGNETGLNRQDGGFTAAKITAELGFLGIGLLIIYFVIAKKAFSYLSNCLDGKRYDTNLVISYSFIYAYLVELFVRGAGYFTQGSFLFFVAISYLFIRKNNEPSNNSQ